MKDLFKKEAEEVLKEEEESDELSLDFESSDSECVTPTMQEKRKLMAAAKKAQPEACQDFPGTNGINLINEKKT